MTRCAVWLCLLLLLGLRPAAAQFEVLDPRQNGTVYPPGVMPELDLHNFTWSIAGYCQREGLLGPELIVLRQGTAQTEGKGPAVSWQRMIGAGGLLLPLGQPVVVAGELESCRSVDLTGDGQDELILSRWVQDEAAAAPEVPFSGRREPAKGPDKHRVLDVWLHDPLLGPRHAGSHVSPAAGSEQLGFLPVEGRYDLVLASFGAHGGGTAASPDTWVRYAIQLIDGDPRLERQPNLVLTPVPILQLLTAQLSVGKPRQLLSLRSFPTQTYKQQLWAQTLNPKGYFENAPIGQGNDLHLLPSPPEGVLGVYFCWTDTRTQPHLTHLTSLRLDGHGAPVQPLDLTFPWAGRVQAAAWGPVLPGLEHPALSLLLKPATGDPWLAVITLRADGSLQGMELHQFAGLADWTQMTAFDLDGEGVAVLLGSGNGEIGKLDLVRRQMGILRMEDFSGSEAQNLLFRLEGEG